MSLGIVILAPEGIVLAAESRVTLSTRTNNPVLVNFDNATKVLSFSRPNNWVGGVTYGLAGIGLRTAHSYIPEFEASLPNNRLTVKEFTQHLSSFFARQWEEEMSSSYDGLDMTFVVGGFDDGDPYGQVYQFDIPSKPEPIQQQVKGEFGITWGGQRDVVDRLIQGFDHRVMTILEQTCNLTEEQKVHVQEELQSLQMQLPLAAMPLQDCVDLAIFFIRTTISAQQLTVGIRGCGGAIDVAVITRRKGLAFIQRKEITGEGGITNQLSYLKDIEQITRRIADSIGGIDN